MSSNGRSPDFDAMYKIVLVGDAGVGKTNLLGYYTASFEERQLNPSTNQVETFSKVRKPTVGVEFATKIVIHPVTGARIKAQIWDTAGQERYRAITNSHYRRAHGALLCYDVTSHGSFDNLNMWIQNLRDSTESTSQILRCVSVVGNKIDLPPIVSNAEHGEFIAAAGLSRQLSARTSAKNGEGIQEVFEKLVVQVHDVEQEKIVDAGKKTDDKVKLGVGAGGSRGGCC